MTALRPRGFHLLAALLLQMTCIHQCIKGRDGELLNLQGKIEANIRCLLESKCLMLKGGARVGSSRGTTSKACNAAVFDRNRAGKGPGKGLPSDARKRSAAPRGRRRRKEDDGESTREGGMVNGKEDPDEYEGGSSWDKMDDSFVEGSGGSGDELDTEDLSRDEKDELLDDDESAEFSETESSETRIARTKNQPDAETLYLCKILEQVGVTLQGGRLHRLAKAFVFGGGVLTDKDTRTAHLRSFLLGCKGSEPFREAINAGRVLPDKILRVSSERMVEDTLSNLDQPEEESAGENQDRDRKKPLKTRRRKLSSESEDETSESEEYQSEPSVKSE